MMATPIVSFAPIMLVISDYALDSEDVLMKM
jgi:hypothetical protein